MNSSEAVTADRRRPVAASGPRAALRQAHWLALAALLLGLYASLGSLAANPAHRCAPDEPAWISSGYLTHRLVAELAAPSRWVTAYDDAGLGSYGNINPPVGKWMTGVIVALVRDPADPIDYVWEWPKGYEENRALGNIPPDALLVSVRRGIAGIAVATLGLVYVLALQVTGLRWASLLAPVVLFLSPVFRIHAAQAYMDVPQLFWLAAAVVAFNEHLRSDRLGWLWLSAAAMGLACAVKFSAAPIVLASASFLALGAGSLRARVGRALGVGALAFAVFCAVNPYLYSQPVERVRSLLADWSALKAGQKSDPLLAPTAIASPLEGLASLTAQTFTHAALDHPWLWKLSALSGPIALACALLLGVALLRFRFSLPPWPPRVRVVACVVLGLLPALWAVGAVGFSLVAIAAGGLALFAPRSGDASTAGLANWRAAPGYLATCVLAMWLVTGLWLPFEWGRYALPTLLLLPPFYVAAVGLVFELARRRVPRALAHAAAGGAAALAEPDLQRETS